jgi:hypothetical protein
MSKLKIRSFLRIRRAEYRIGQSGISKIKDNFFKINSIMKTTISKSVKNSIVSPIQIVIVAVLMLLPSFFFAQSAFDKLDGQDEVNSIIVNKKMFELMSKVKVDSSDKETLQYLNLIKKLDNLKVFTTNNSRISLDMKTMAEKHLKSSSLEELMHINDNGKNIKIYVKSGAKDAKIKELLMFMESNSKTKQTVLMSLTGDFDLNELSVLTDKMRMPGGEELKRATKGKK